MVPTDAVSSPGRMEDAMSTESTAPPPPASHPELARWQKRLLPFMTGSIVAMAFAFFLFSGLHLYQITRFIGVEDSPNIRVQVAAEIAKASGTPATSMQVLQNSLLLLEADALNKRYHQASALLMSRIWSRQMAFITGMVLAFLGAVFILGKMSEPPSQISGGAANWQMAISSASPGIILCFFGTVLLLTSLLVRTSLDVADGPAYLSVIARPPGAAAADTPALPASGSVGQTDRAPLTLDDFSKFEKPAAQK